MGIVLSVILALVLGVFALANPQDVALRLWPQGWVAELALWQAILLPAALAFLAGALVVSAAHARQRRRLAELEQAATLMEAELTERDRRRRA